MTRPVNAVDRWARACGVGAIAAALPAVIWRVVLGTGATLGTSSSWRRSEGLPGPGTSYVVTLSVIQLAAALLTVVLVVPNADRVPGWSSFAAGRRLPARLVLGVSLTGTAVLSVLCVGGAVNWSRVDPFRDAATVSGWADLCWACYALATAWPVLVLATTVGYGRARRRAQRADTADTRFLLSPCSSHPST